MKQLWRNMYINTMKTSEFKQFSCHWKTFKQLFPVDKTMRSLNGNSKYRSTIDAL